MKSYLKMPANPKCCKENVIQGEHYRITVLTESLLRLEYSADGVFEDRATQTVLNRDFPKVNYEVKETEEELQVRTSSLQLNYDKKEFTPQGLSCKCLGGSTPSSAGWRYGDKIEDLKGTTRTLDRVNGSCELDSGLMSWFGFSVMDDSRSLLLTEDGWVAPRKKGVQDLYFFGYGHEYLRALKDFYHLCGKTPMLPRFALGNWWSRYYEYSEESYMELMKKFDEEEIPFSVAVIDMDWHLVDIDPKYGNGWTGYTWNKKLFPDPKRFLGKLHDRGMKTTLNVHPADGIRAYEDCYPEVAEAMGVDASKEEPVNFDIADPKFLEVYLDKAHHPLEEEGVDFWWIDWQQGQSTKIDGLDPLWMLNHYHFLDSQRDGKRPMTFSRYAGPGSHRYPVGFSGDSVISWESLEFQPYFTSTASNIGYGWWSHDIGGHMMGYKDDELEARWYQYGVFSPINRLHSTKNLFNGKEPWRFRPEVRRTMDDFLRLRHKLIPYLYTMNYRAWKEDEPLIWPMYYEYPENALWNFCQTPNQYRFGSELIVSPVTSKIIPGVNRARTKVWLPEGTWFDFFDGMKYQGGRNIDMYRSLDSMPVLAKAGAIIPMTERISAKEVQTNPDQLTLRVYAGADNSFELYEDDNETTAYQQGVCALTPIMLDWTGSRTVKVGPVKGHTELIPESRAYRIELWGSTAATSKVLINGTETEAVIARDEDKRLLTVCAEGVKPGDCLEIVLPEDTTTAKNDVTGRAFDLLNQAEISFMQKEQIYRLVERKQENVAVLAGELQAMKLPDDLRGAVLEIVTAD
ncbi:MAG: TIM-barrel domain-containing protein [Fusicatenibacter sp.]|nr:glycoside hydrolase family 31 protein [Fusicatenibacter sp.]